MRPNSVLPRRNLRELTAIHKLEPSTHDVVVEGMRDRALIEWFLTENGRKDFVVYEINLFEIAPEWIFARRLEDNNRGRVITMAQILSAELPASASLTLIADRDFDFALNIEHVCRLLLLTDY